MPKKGKAQIRQHLPFEHHKQPAHSRLLSYPNKAKAIQMGGAHPAWEPSIPGLKCSMKTIAEKEEAEASIRQWIRRSVTRSGV